MNQNVILCSQDDEDWMKVHDRPSEGKEDTDVTLQDKVLWYKGRLWIHKSINHRNMTLQVEHDSKVADHMGQAKTIELV